METPLAPQEIGLSPAFKDFVSGAVGGMLGVVTGQPLDTIRVRLQQQTGRANTIAGMWRAALHSGEGVRGLFKGMSYPLVTTALQNAVTFQSQRAAFRALCARNPTAGAAAAPAAAAASGSESHAPAAAPPGHHVCQEAPSTSGDGARVPWSVTAMAGMTAGAVQSCISSPVELLKIRMQLQLAPPGSPGYTGSLVMLRRVLRQEGASGLTRGLGVTLLRDTPSYGLYFVAYEAMCDSLMHLAAHTGVWTRAPATRAPAVQFLAGGLAGMVAWLSVYPVDLVKTRLQAHPAASSPYRGGWHCAVATWQQEGSAAFIRGLGATMARAFVVNATIFATFEWCDSAFTVG